jgi:hypothetical protein
MYIYVDLYRLNEESSTDRLVVLNIFFRARRAGQGIGGSKSTTARAPGGTGTRRRHRQIDDEHQEAAAPEGVAIEGEESRGAATGGD